MDGRIFVLSGYSGVGKNTIINNVLLKNPSTFVYIPSYTTRSMRSGESEGNPYYFLLEEDFNELKNNNEFIEYEEIHGNEYATHFKSYKKALDEGKNILKDIDVNGALAFKERLGEKVVSIFISPPSLSELKERLIKRGDNEGDIKTRLERIKFEESKKHHFKYEITNDSLENATNEVMTIIEKEMN